MPLLLIFTLSFTIHIVVRYLELIKDESLDNHRLLVSQAVKEKFKPCLYAAITTMVAFCSLLVSGVQPLIDFGIIMSTGLLFSFVVVFTFFAASLMLFYPKKQLNIEFNITAAIMRFVSSNVEKYKKIVWFLFFFICAGSLFL